MLELGRLSTVVVARFDIRMYSRKCDFWMATFIDSFKAKKFPIVCQTSLWNLQ